MKLKSLCIIVILCCLSITIVWAATELTIETDDKKITVRYDFGWSKDGSLYSGSAGAAWKTKGEDAGFYWESGTMTSYTGGNLWLTGTYKWKVEIKPFYRDEEGTFEGPVESRHTEMIELSITPPPQNKDMPEISRCNANSEIKSGNQKAKSSI